MRLRVSMESFLRQLVDFTVLMAFQHTMTKELDLNIPPGGISCPAVSAGHLPRNCRPFGSRRVSSASKFHSLFERLGVSSDAPSCYWHWHQHQRRQSLVRYILFSQ